MSRDDALNAMKVFKLKAAALIVFSKPPLNAATIVSR